MESLRELSYGSPKCTPRYREQTMQSSNKSFVRPLHKSDKTADRLEKRINELMETEKDQGISPVPSPSPTLIGRAVYFSASGTGSDLDPGEKTRQWLAEFIGPIKTALATLIALASWS
ncbi:hypothetical protein QCA50_020868 [Cerrena zonata]|uniref:Uncharacterized protein n=1 Tax=Cerrena zonata TaxID=2478898 RepID=A0AAW0FBA9_9APHY